MGEGNSERDCVQDGPDRNTLSDGRVGKKRAAREGKRGENQKRCAGIRTVTDPMSTALGPLRNGDMGKMRDTSVAEIKNGRRKFERDCFEDDTIGTR